MVLAWLPRLWPSDPRAGRPRAAAHKELWGTIKQFRSLRVRVLTVGFILWGIALTSAYSPFSLASDYYGDRGAFLARDAVFISGFPLIGVIWLQAFLVWKYQKRSTSLLWVGAWGAVLGFAVAIVVPLASSQLGGLATIVEVVVVEGAADTFLIVVLARLNALGGRGSAAALVAYIVGKHAAFAPIGVLLAYVEERMGVGEAAALNIFRGSGLVAAVLLLLLARPVGRAIAGDENEEVSSSA